MTWLTTIDNWLRHRSGPKPIPPHLLRLHEIEKDVALEDVEEATAGLMAKVMKVTAHGADEEVRHQQGLAAGAAARRARLQAEADVIRRQYAIPE